MKRVFDIVMASAGLILFSPLLFVTAILIKLDSPGPIFFRQERMGKEISALFHLQISHDETAFRR